MTRSPFRRLVFGTLRRLLYLWVRSETINQSSFTLNLDRSRPVFYVLQNPSLTDLAVVDTECTKAGLPRPVLSVSVGNLLEPAAFFYLTPDPDWLGRQDKRGAPPTLSVRDVGVDLTGELIEYRDLSYAYANTRLLDLVDLLAERITALLHAAGQPSQADAQRGFDHGMFIPLLLMVPQADIPVVQLSLQPYAGTDWHRRLGAALRALVRPYILRRLKTDRRIIADLPDKTEVRVFCPLTKTQAALYEESVREMAGKLKEARGIQRRGLVLAYLMRFKQICNHPSQWLGNQAYGTGASGKFQRLRVLCEEIASRQEKLLVFTQFREMTEPLAALLAETFLRPGLVLHGGTGVGKRREIVEAFQREEGPPFFVLSLKAGGVGLNLTAASHVIHFDRWWNPAVENQATDRAFRIGQKKNVLVHKFVCRGTVEEKIDALIEDKKELVESILGGDREKLVTEMPDEELIRFVSLDLSRALDEENNGKKKMDRRNSG